MSDENTAVSRRQTRKVYTAACAYDLREVRRPAVSAVYTVTPQPEDGKLKLVHLKGTLGVGRKRA